jgi:acetoacetyl-CoA synthetase
METRKAAALWKPSHPDSNPISIYRRHINKKFKQNLENSQDLHRWTVTCPHEFWIDLWDYVGLIPSLPGHITRAYDETKSIRDIPLFFEGVEINYTENVLSNRDPNAIALIGLREGQSLDGEQWTWKQLSENVRKTRSALLRSGVKRGDRVAALMSNSPWTITIFLATATISAVFTSISPEMGASGCIGRLEQVSPRILFADSHQIYKGKRKPMQDKVDEIARNLREMPTVIIVPLLEERYHYTTLPEFLAQSSNNDLLEYLRVPFSEPLVIVYSSGSTGPSKCIVHQHGVILNFKKIAFLHNSLTLNDVVFQYSSTSWILWNIMNGHLSVGATLICYDGSPLYPDPSTMLKILEHHKATYFGTSPRYLLELEMSGIPPSQFDLGALRMVTTTGATLTADQFRWFYRAFPKSIHLSSVAGGTEICSSWLASDPAGPIYAGEMQIPALGHDVDVADSETGESLKQVLMRYGSSNSELTISQTGQAGELICRAPFPSMPVYFWNDPGNKKYHEAYFEKYTHIPVWAQHDWVQFNPSTGGAQIHGRR